MDVRLLGPLEVSAGGHQLRLGGRKQRALLAVLALGAGRTLSTERLVDELWGEDVPETAVKMVQIYVSQLRKVLPEGAVVTRSPGYALAVEPDAVDLRRFERLVGEGREALAGGDPARAAALLREALGLWRGPALAEFASEPFGRVEIPRLEELHLSALEERVEADLALGRHVDLVGELEALVGRHPLRERLRGQQLVALYRSGRQADALASYQSFRRMLDEQLGIEPSARLRELERLILRQDPTLELPAASGGASAGARPAAPAPRAPAPRPVGRDAELDALHAELERARAGDRRLVVVTGEPGAGKSAVLDAFLAEAEAAGALAARGLCLEQRGPGEPYLPVLDALGRLGGGRCGDDVVRVLRRRAPTWLAQMPWLVEPGEQELLHGAVLGATRERMLRELGEALDALAEEAPLVLALEDLHHADLATVDAVAWLARRGGPAPLLLVCSLSPAAGGDAADGIRALCDELRVRRRSVEVELGPLGEEALSALVAARTGPCEASGRLGAVLLERTGGNPLFAETVLDGWLADGALVERDGAWELAAPVEELRTAVPESIRAVVLAQLEALEPEEQALVEAAGVAGAEAAAAALAAATGTTEHEVELLAERLVRRERFLVRLEPAEWPDGSVTGRYGFRHGLHREVVYEHVPAARRARLHRLLARRLEEAWGDRAVEVAAELARHYERGLEPARAVRYLRLAAELALRRLAPRPACELLRAALRTLRGLPEGVDRDRLELDLLSLLGQALVVADGWASADAEEALDRARELGRRLADNEPVVPVLVALGTIYEARGDYERAEETAVECLRLVPEAVDGRRLQAHEVLACSLFHQGSFSRALEHAELGVGLADLDGDEPEVVVYGDDVEIACHDWAALSLWFLGRPDAALARARRALRLAEEPRRAYGLAAAHVQLAIVHQCRGEVEEAERAAATAAELAAERGYAYRAALGAVVGGWARVASGRAEGLRELRDGLDAALGTGVRMDDPYLLGLLADALIRLDRPGEAAEAIGAGLERPSFYESELLRLRAVLERSRGDTAAAEETLAAALDLAGRQGARALELRIAVDLGGLLAAAGRDVEARSVVRAARDGVRGGDSTADARAADALLAGLPAPAGAAPGRPPVRHLLSGGVRLAYQVTGEGPPDLLLVPGLVSHLELDWAHPGYARFLERLGGAGRLIRADKRGTGLSDRSAGVPDLEARVDDLRAVLDAAASERAVVVGVSEGASTALLLAATHPGRVRALVLVAGYATRVAPDDDYPWVPTAEEREAFADLLLADGGFEWDAATLAPSADDALAAWWAERYRAGASPDAVRALLEMNARIDVREVLPAIAVPTLVVHRGSGYVLPEEARYLAGRIPGARLVELPGPDQLVAVDPDGIADVVEAFVRESAAAPEPADTGRLLTTLLVTDIADSTETLARVGDAAWADLLARHHAIVREELARHRGVEVDDAGDGFLASFDGPGRAIRCALAVQARLGELGLAARAGVHTGEVERSAGSLRGIAVHLACRVAAEAEAGEVLVTATTRDLVAGAGFAFADRGERALRGLGEPRRLYAALRDAG